MEDDGGDHRPERVAGRDRPVGRRARGAPAPTVSMQTVLLAPAPPARPVARARPRLPSLSPDEAVKNHAVKRFEAFRQAGTLAEHHRWAERCVSLEERRGAVGHVRAVELPRDDGLREEPREQLVLRRLVASVRRLHRRIHAMHEIARVGALPLDGLKGGEARVEQPPKTLDEGASAREGMPHRVENRLVTTGRELLDDGLFGRELEVDRSDANLGFAGNFGDRGLLGAVVPKEPFGRRQDERAPLVVRLVGAGPRHERNDERFSAAFIPGVLQGMLTPLPSGPSVPFTHEVPAVTLKQSRSLLPWDPPSNCACVSDLLADCHARIRYFADLAVRLAEGESCPVDAAEAAARIRRYFTEAYPLHLADEHDSVLPRLRARAPEVEPLLQRLELEHRCLDAKLPELLDVCDGLESGDATRCREAVQKLRMLGECMHTLLYAHLENEEQQLFPLLREKLTAEDVDAIRGEFRERRAAMMKKASGDAS